MAMTQMIQTNHVVNPYSKTRSNRTLGLRSGLVAANDGQTGGVGLVGIWPEMRNGAEKWRGEEGGC